jgi:hypothetical protein
LLMASLILREFRVECFEQQAVARQVAVHLFNAPTLQRSIIDIMHPFFKAIFPVF